MKKVILSIAFVAAMAFIANAQKPATTTPPTTTNAQQPATSTEAAPANPNAPEITFETEVVDYGTIENGSDGNREFKFKNTGKEPLIITSATGSCGCTIPTPPKDPIKPGEKSTIKVHYDTKRTGHIDKTITVVSNAKTPVKQLRITGDVKPEAVSASTPATPATTAPATTPKK